MDLCISRIAVLALQTVFFKSDQARKQTREMMWAFAVNGLRYLRDLGDLLVGELPLRSFI